jgi:hypothetical protein
MENKSILDFKSCPKCDSDYGYMLQAKSKSGTKHEYVRKYGEDLKLEEIYAGDIPSKEFFQCRNCKAKLCDHTY